MQRLGSHVDLRNIKGKGIHTMNLIVYNKGADMYEGNVMTIVGATGRTSLQRRGPNSFGNWQRSIQRPFTSYHVDIGPILITIGLKIVDQRPRRRSAARALEAMTWIPRLAVPQSTKKSMNIKMMRTADGEVMCFASRAVMTMEIRVPTANCKRGTCHTVIGDLSIRPTASIPQEASSSTS